MLSRLLSRSLKPRAIRRGGDSHGHHAEPYSNEPKVQRLFGELPLQPGQSRKWEDWEAPYYLTGILTVVMMGLGLKYAPETSIRVWAREEAQKKLDEESS